MDQQVKYDDKQSTGPVIVFNMKNEYKSLEGEYRDTRDIEIKLYKLQQSEPWPEQNLKWKEVSVCMTTRKIVYRHKHNYYCTFEDIGEYRLN